MILARLERAQEDRLRLEEELAKVKGTVEEIKEFVVETRTANRFLLGLLGITATLGTVINYVMVWAKNG